MLNLSMRIRRPELMDDLYGSTGELGRALQALARVNTLSMSAYFLSNAIMRLLGPQQKNIRILDLGSGRGDLLCSVKERLQKFGLKVEAVGIDIHPNSVELAARYANARRCSARFVTIKAIDALKKFEYDVVISSLFLHHFSEEEIIELFSVIQERASIGMVMSDLERSSLGYGLTWLATHMLSRSYIVQHDGLASVEGALTKDEFQKLTDRAGLTNCRLTRTFPLRIMMSWKRGLLCAA